jgi:UDP-N-acetylmuramyl pentapeptide phosphotransferase/UDP-N-acetylglucosamine-1-phosphate transferase
LIGFAEDLVKRVPPGARLAVLVFSAALGIALLQAQLLRLDLGVAWLLAIPWIGVPVTLFMVAGVANAINIIDGLNGLASAVCLLAFAAIAYVSYRLGDHHLTVLAGLGFGATLGFFVWNYPGGLLFCGDGGAYFLGTQVALLSILLVNRHPQVSAWFPLLLVLYPVWETLFSAFRRQVLRKKKRKSMSADKLHLHTLLYKRFASNFNVVRDGTGHTWHNSDIAGLLMILAGVNVMPAVIYWRNTKMLMLSAGLFLVVYLLLYRSLVKFKMRDLMHRTLSAVDPRRSDTP